MKVSAGPFKPIYNPSLGEDKPWYINDHSIIQGEDGWHLFGITHEEPADPLDEKLCAHAVSEDIVSRPFVKKPPCFSSSSVLGEAHFWAPHVIKDNGIYYMFYCAGSLAGHDQYQILLRTSKDLYDWQWHPENPLVVDGFDARDPMVIRAGDRWYMYYTCTTAPQGGNHCVAAVESSDLIHWGKKRNVFVDEQIGTFAGPCESPFVVSYGEWYFLFLSCRKGYASTEVFASRDPLDFQNSSLVGTIPSHASEIINIGNEFYITHCGWGEGGVYLARLFFEF